MVKKSEHKNFDNFSEWLQALTAAKQEDSDTGAQLREARGHLARVTNGAEFAGGAMARQINYICGSQADASDRRAMMAMLRRSIDEVPPEKMSLGHRDNVRDWKGQLEELEIAEQRVNDAACAVSDLETAKEATATYLATIEAQQPPADAAALKSVDAEIRAVESECSKIEGKLNQVVTAREAAEASASDTATLDQLEARAALDEGGSGAALTRARKAAQDAQGAISSLQSQERGLRDLLAQAAATLEDLRSVRSHISKFIHEEENEEAEAEFFKSLQHLEKCLAVVNRARQQSNSATGEDHEYQLAHISLVLPPLYGKQAPPEGSEYLQLKSR